MKLYRLMNRNNTILNSLGSIFHIIISLIANELKLIFS